jgi:hypothetical protein
LLGLQQYTLAATVLAEAAQHSCLLLDRDHKQPRISLQNYYRKTLLPQVRSGVVLISLSGGEKVSVELAMQMYILSMSMVPAALENRYRLSVSPVGRVLQECACFGVKLCVSEKEELYGNVLHHSNFHKNNDGGSAGSAGGRKKSHTTNYWQLLQQFRFAAVFGTTSMLIAQQQIGSTTSTSPFDLPPIASRVSLLASMHIQFHIWDLQQPGWWRKTHEDDMVTPETWIRMVLSHVDEIDRSLCRLIDDELLGCDENGYLSDSSNSSSDPSSSDPSSSDPSSSEDEEEDRADNAAENRVAKKKKVDSSKGLPKESGGRKRKRGEDEVSSTSTRSNDSKIDRTGNNGHLVAKPLVAGQVTLLRHLKATAMDKSGHRQLMGACALHPKEN